MSSYQKGNVWRKQFIVVGEINQAKYLFSLIICLAQMHINPPLLQPYSGVPFVLLLCSITF